MELQCGGTLIKHCKFASPLVKAQCAIGFTHESRSVCANALHGRSVASTSQ